MGRTVVALAVAVAAALVVTAPARAQRLDIWVDGRATHARPPAGIASAEAATYGILGARADAVFGSGASASAMLHGGRAATGGDAWFSAFAGAGSERRKGPVVIGGSASAFSLDYLEPFRYAARGIALRPRIRTDFGRTRVTIAGDLRRGRWRTEYDAPDGGPGGPPGRGGPPTSEPTTSVEGTLSVAGASARIRRAIGPGRLNVTVERLDAENGAAAGVYRGARAEYAFEVGDATARVAAHVQESPDPVDGSRDAELGFHFGLDVPVGADGVAHVDAGRTVADPLYGAAGAVATSLAMSWRFRVVDDAGPPPIAAVGAASADGRRIVRFRVRAPRAQTVALAGDFSDWEPVAMRRADDGAWVLELTLTPGLHHFAFRIDGERWYVPDDAPGIVDDGWGRRNASIVVEPE